MKVALIHAEKARFPVAFMCRHLGVSRSGYYAWLERPAPKRAVEDAEIVAEISAAHARSRETFGSPRIHVEVRARGRRVGKKRVERLMRENGIRARRKRRFPHTTDSNHSNPVAPNVVERKFAPLAPSRIWVTDVTYVWTDDGWLPPASG